MEQNPPRVNSREEFMKWMCEIHNSINKLLNKPQFDCDLCELRWRLHSFGEEKDIAEYED